VGCSLTSYYDLEFHFSLFDAVFLVDMQDIIFMLSSTYAAIWCVRRV